MQRIIVFLIWILTFFPSLTAQDIEFTVSAPDQVSVGERFRVIFQLNKRPARFSGPSFEGFSVLSGPNQSSSTSMQIINNRTTVTENYSYSYIIEATSEGQVTIQPARVIVDGDEFSSDPFQINVVAGQATPPPSGQSQGTQQPQEFASAQDLFIRATPGTSTPYQGQQVIITYTLYTRVPVNQYSIDVLPNFRGFWTENLTPDGQPQTRTQVIDGSTYRVAEIYRVAAFAQRAGELTIDPLHVEAVVSLPGQRRPSLFDEFFGGSPFDQRRQVQQTIRSNAVTLQVKPLPTQNKPAAFSGMVGDDFTVNASVNTTEVKVNDAVNLSVTVTGRGNMRMLEDPTFNFPPNLEVFDPNITDDIRNTITGVSGKRTYDYVMIPRTAGEYEIPPWSFVYFDPSEQTYKTLQTPSFLINVTGSGDENKTMADNARQEDIQNIATDIRYIQTDSVNLKPAGKHFYKSTLFWVLLIIPFVVFAFFVVYWRSYIRLQNNSTLRRNRKAEKLARKRLKAARIFLQKRKENECYDEIFR
ncbi:MAG: BatD family protein, partial [Bacteroidota bacterium]